MSRLEYWKARSSQKRQIRFDSFVSDAVTDFTPTYSSWLNQVEIWFSKVERDAMLAESLPA
jgi:transposase